MRCLTTLAFDDNLIVQASEAIKARQEAEKEAKKKAWKAKKKGHKAGGVDADTQNMFKDAAGSRDIALRARMQSKVIEAVFEVYFRVLKEFANGKGGLSAFPTLESALAGLTKHAKYINADFMGDLFKARLSLSLRVSLRVSRCLCLSLSQRCSSGCSRSTSPRRALWRPSPPGTALCPSRCSCASCSQSTTCCAAR